MGQRHGRNCRSLREVHEIDFHIDLGKGTEKVDGTEFCCLLPVFEIRHTALEFLHSIHRYEVAGREHGLFLRELEPGVGSGAKLLYGHAGSRLGIRVPVGHEHEAAARGQCVFHFLGILQP